MSMPLAGTLLLHHGAYRIKNDFIFLVGKRQGETMEYGLWVVPCLKEEIPDNLSETYATDALYTQLFASIQSCHQFLADTFGISVMGWEALAFNPLTLYLDGEA
jgi:hypothetical protein